MMVIPMDSIQVHYLIDCECLLSLVSTWLYPDDLRWTYRWHAAITNLLWPFG